MRVALRAAGSAADCREGHRQRDFHDCGDKDASTRVAREELIAARQRKQAAGRGKPFRQRRPATRGEAGRATRSGYLWLQSVHSTLFWVLTVVASSWICSVLARPHSANATATGAIARQRISAPHSDKRLRSVP